MVRTNSRASQVRPNAICPVGHYSALSTRRLGYEVRNLYRGVIGGRSFTAIPASPEMHTAASLCHAIIRPREYHSRHAVNAESGRPVRKPQSRCTIQSTIRNLASSATRLCVAGAVMAIGCLVWWPQAAACDAEGGQHRRTGVLLGPERSAYMRAEAAELASLQPLVAGGNLPPCRGPAKPEVDRVCGTVRACLA